MAIEFIPTTISGNAQRRQPFQSIRAYRPASINSTRPPLYSVYDDVHTRFTIGQIPTHWHTRPRNTKPAPAIASPRSFSSFDFVLLSHSPVRSPMIIVASVGIKLSVDQPPSLKTNGCSRGKRFRNHTSKAHDRFEFLLKCDRKPV